MTDQPGDALQRPWTIGDYPVVARHLLPISTQVVAEIGIRAGDQVLDIGVGTGNAAMGCEVRRCLLVVHGDAYLVGEEVSCHLDGPDDFRDCECCRVRATVIDSRRRLWSVMLPACTSTRPVGWAMTISTVPAAPGRR